MTAAREQRLASAMNNCDCRMGGKSIMSVADLSFGMSHHTYHMPTGTINKKILFTRTSKVEPAILNGFLSCSHG